MDEVRLLQLQLLQDDKRRPGVSPIILRKLALGFQASEYLVAALHRVAKDWREVKNLLSSGGWKQGSASPQELQNIKLLDKMSELLAGESKTRNQVAQQLHDIITRALTSPRSESEDANLLDRLHQAYLDANTRLGLLSRTDVPPADISLNIFMECVISDAYNLGVEAARLDFFDHTPVLYVLSPKKDEAVVRTPDSPADVPAPSTPPQDPDQASAGIPAPGENETVHSAPGMEAGFLQHGRVEVEATGATVAPSDDSPASALDGLVPPELEVMPSDRRAGGEEE